MLGFESDMALLDFVREGERERAVISVVSRADLQSVKILANCRQGLGCARACRRVSGFECRGDRALFGSNAPRATGSPWDSIVPEMRARAEFPKPVIFQPSNAALASAGSSRSTLGGLGWG